MKVVYTAPNKAHHYLYAKALHKAGYLKAFVCGFSRLSPRGRLPEIGNTMRRVDLLQTLFILTLRLRFSDRVTAKFAYYAKIEQDLACKRFIKGSDIFLFYNGSGLYSCQFAKKNNVITVVEVVNTHVDFQEKLLEEEHRLLNLPFTHFDAKEKKRRIEEYHEADFIMYPSEFVKKSFLAYGFSEEKMVKVSYGYNQYELTDKKQIKGAFTVLYVGSISVRKGLRYLIQAFENLKQVDKKLVIVGATSELTGFEDITLPAEIHFTGVLKGKDLETVYKSADVFCLPSIEDGFGLVIGEALSYGIPVIATTNTGAPEIIEEGKNGFIVPIRDAQAIHDKLSLLTKNPKLLLEMSSEAATSAQKLKGWENTNVQLISALENCKLRHHGKN